MLRDAQHLAALEVVGDAMVLTLMRYAEELVDVSEFTFPRAEIRKPELQMARTLVEQFADTWDPSQYTDEYRANLMKIIKAKLKGKKPQLVEHVKPQQAEVVDLMERLRQSLQGAGGQAHDPPRASKPRARSESDVGAIVAIDPSRANRSVTASRTRTRRRRAA